MTQQVRILSEVEQEWVKSVGVMFGEAAIPVCGVGQCWVGWSYVGWGGVMLIVGWGNEAAIRVSGGNVG